MELKNEVPTLEKFRAVPSLGQKTVLHLRGNIQLPSRKFTYYVLGFHSEIQRQ